MTAENLAININDPLKPYHELKGSNVLGEALSGSVDCKAYDWLITDPQKQLFVPIIQWIDHTSVTGNDRFSLKPYMFSPAIFTEKFRRSIKAWGYHGFLPKRKSSSAQLHMGDAIRIYHKELDAVLESFRNCSPQLCGVHLPISPTGRLCVDIVTCVLFIIQDMQEGDMLCGRYGVHTSGIQRPHRCCDVNYDDLKNYDVHCKYIIASDMGVIARSNDDDLRKRGSQHKLENAFEHISLLCQPSAWNLRGHSHVDNACIMERCHWESNKTYSGQSSSIQEGCLWLPCHCISQISSTNTPKASEAQYIIFVPEYDLFFSNMYELFNSTILNKKGGATVVWIISAEIYAHKKLIFINSSYVFPCCVCCWYYVAC